MAAQALRLPLLFVPWNPEDTFVAALGKVADERIVMTQKLEYELRSATLGRKRACTSGTGA
jgi:hypothetical protein